MPLQTVAAKSSFADSLSALHEHIKSNVAAYVLMRRYDESPKMVAVTYVPDAAPVRQKMLFASTRLTLVRDLGLEHFRETIYFTIANEFSEEGFKKHDAHTELEAPLTAEERTLSEVKAAELAASTGTGTREIHLSKSLAMPVKEDAIAAMKDVGSGSRVVTMLVCKRQSR